MGHEHAHRRRSRQSRHPRRRIAWIATAVALGLVIELHLLSALFAGLLVYKLVDVLTPWLRLRALGRDGPKALAVTLIASAVIAALVGIGIGVATILRNSSEDIPQLMQRMAQIIEESRSLMPAALLAYLPEDANALQRAIVDALREHAGSLQLAGRGIGRSLIHVLFGMIIGALLSLQKATQFADRRPLTEEIARRAARLGSAFQRVVFAQVWISLINTFFTWLYLDVVLRAVRRRPAAGEDPGGAHVLRRPAADHRQPDLQHRDRRSSA